MKSQRSPGLSLRPAGGRTLFTSCARWRSFFGEGVVRFWMKIWDRFPVDPLANAAGTLHPPEAGR